MSSNSAGALTSIVGRDELLPLAKVARKLGLCNKTVYKMGAAGHLELVRLSARCTKVRGSSLRALLAQGREK